MEQGTLWIGLKGKKRSGKSTVARKLRQLAGSSSAADVEFSDPIIEAVNLALAKKPRGLYRFSTNLLKGAEVVTGERLAHPELAILKELRPDVMKALADWLKSADPEVRLNRQNKDDHRALLSFLGVLGRHPKIGHPSIWSNKIDQILAEINGEPLVTAAGVRFPEDAGIIRDRHGVIVEVHRSQVEDQDPANEKRSLVSPDVEIWNDGSKAELETATESFYHDLKNGRFNKVNGVAWYSYPMSTLTS
jgi:hypothetical protein